MLCESPQVINPIPNGKEGLQGHHQTIGRVVVVSATPILNDRIIRCQEATVICV
jgi:hypothetical protein